MNIFEELNEKVIFSIHPRTLKTLKETKLLNQLINCKNVIVTQPLGYMDFLSIMKNAQKILTDSGGVQKEAYLLETPCITTRNNTEWTETVEQKWNILVGMNKKKIINAVKNIHPQTKGIKSVFGNGNTSQIIFQHIKSKLE